MLASDRPPLLTVSVGPDTWEWVREAISGMTGARWVLPMDMIEVLGEAPETVYGLGVLLEMLEWLGETPGVVCDLIELLIE